jgi:hypothetical protein
MKCINSNANLLFFELLNMCKFAYNRKNIFFKRGKLKEIRIPHQIRRHSEPDMGVENQKWIKKNKQTLTLELFVSKGNIFLFKKDFLFFFVTKK